MHRSSLARVAAIALLAVVAAAGCAGGSTAAPANVTPSAAASAAGQSAAASAPAAGPAVTIKDFAFNPATIQAKVGDTITWTNSDSTAHTVTLDDKSVDSGNVAPSATFSHAFTQAGTFTYHCEIHKQMKGTITVG